MPSTSAITAVTEEMAHLVISSSATPPTSVAPTNTTPTSNLPAGAPEPRFSYVDISVAGVGGLAAHVTVNGQVKNKFETSLNCENCYTYIVLDRYVISSNICFRIAV